MQPHGLSMEVRSKVLAARPRTLGEAARIPGMTPAAQVELARLAVRVAGAKAAAGSG